MSEVTVSKTSLMFLPINTEKTVPQQGQSSSEINPKENKSGNKTNNN